MTDDEADMYYDRWLASKTTIKHLEAEIKDLEERISKQNQWEDLAIASMNAASEALGVYVCDQIPEAARKLNKYRDFVKAFYYEPMEMSHHKLPSQYNHWQQSAGKLLYQNEPDTGFTDEELGHRTTRDD